MTRRREIFRVEKENTAQRIWNYTDFDGMRLALRLIDACQPTKRRLTDTESLLLIRLFACKVRDSEMIDTRFSQARLATHYNKGISTVERAMRKFKRYGLIEVVDEPGRGHSTALRIRISDIEDFLGRLGGDAM